MTSIPTAQAFCTSCGGALHDGARFCVSCGAPRAAAAAFVPHQPATAGFAQAPVAPPVPVYAVPPVVAPAPAPGPTTGAPHLAPPASAAPPSEDAAHAAPPAVPTYAALHAPPTPAGVYAPVTVVPSASPRRMAPVAPPGSGPWAQHTSGPDPLARIGDQLRDIPLSVLIPLRTWWEDGSWRRGPLGLFLLFALVPTFLLHATQEDSDVERIAWGFSIYFGAAWMLVMHALIRPEKQSGWLLTRIVAFTTFAGVAIAIALEEWFDPGDSWGAMVFGVGLPEEFAKGLAVWLFVSRFSAHAWSTRTYLFAGAVSGLAFGTAEAVLYSVRYQEILYYVGSADSSTGYTGMVLWRLVVGGLSHALMAGIVAFFIGLAHYHREKAALLMGVGLLTVAVLHGTYNRFSSGWGGLAIDVLIAFIFVGYVRSGDDIHHEYRSTSGVAT